MAFHQGRIVGPALPDQIAELVATTNAFGQSLQQPIVLSQFPFGIIAMHQGQRLDVLLQVIEQRHPFERQVEGDQANHDDREGDAKSDDLAGRAGLL
jgi:hypothetical protein